MLLHLNYLHFCNLFVCFKISNLIFYWLFIGSQVFGGEYAFRLATQNRFLPLIYEPLNCYTQSNCDIIMVGKRKAPAKSSPSPKRKNKTGKMDAVVEEGKAFVAAEKKRERSRSRSRSTSKSPARKAGRKAATGTKKATTPRGRSTSPKPKAKKAATTKKATSASKKADKPEKSPSRKQPNRRAKSPTGRTTAVKIKAPKASDGKKKTADQRAAEEASNWVVRANKRERRAAKR